MRPCDAHDGYTARTKLRELGMYVNEDGIKLQLGRVLLTIGPCKIELSTNLMKRIAEWYLEDQDETD